MVTSIKIASARVSPFYVGSIGSRTCLVKFQKIFTGTLPGYVFLKRLKLYISWVVMAEFSLCKLANLDGELCGISKLIAHIGRESGRKTR